MPLGATGRRLGVIVVGTIAAVAIPGCGDDGGGVSDLVFPATRSGVEQVAVLSVPDDGVLLAWTTPTSGGRDVWVSALDRGAFTSPVRAADVPATSQTMEEMRPALAVSGDGRVAVAWATEAFDINVAFSDDGGTTFGSSIRLNGDSGEAIQVLPAIGFDGAGSLHAVWLDPRLAPPGAEEPADLYYARVDDDLVNERNLTDRQASSVCGCCRPHLQIDDEEVIVTFRNTTEDGYRDPFQIAGTVDGAFAAPRAVTRPTWRIDACPIAGPVGLGDAVVWLDGSTGRRRILASDGPDAAAGVLVEDSDGVRIRAAPREAGGFDEPTVLVPARPASLLFQLDGSRWRLLADDLPEWATGAVRQGEQLVVIGGAGGELMHATLPRP